MDQGRSQLQIVIAMSAILRGRQVQLELIYSHLIVRYVHTLLKKS